MTIKPLDHRAKQLQIILNIQMLVFPKGAITRENSVLNSKKVIPDLLKQYQINIAKRNLFSPPNYVPSLNLTTVRTINNGKQVRIKISVEDRNQLDKLSLELSKQFQDNLNLGEAKISSIKRDKNQLNGFFVWTPQIKNLKKTKQFCWRITAQDDAVFPLMASKEIKVEVKPNRAPRLSKKISRSGKTGELLSLQIKASDPDRADRLTYKLGKNAPLGFRIDRRSGRVSWRPKKQGTYRFNVIAQDDGYPRLRSSVELELKIAIGPPPKIVKTVKVEKPPRLDFDHANFTYVTHIGAVNGKPVIWLHNRPKGQKIICDLENRKEINIGSVRGKVVMIDPINHYFEMVAYGKRRRIYLQNKLSDYQLVTVE